MGNLSSSRKKAERIKGRGGHRGERTSNTTNRGEEYNDPQLLLLKRTIERNPEMFVLNNLMMCVQFFGNYEQEMKLVKETLVSSREKELNKRLPPQKHVLLPDVLQEHIARYVGFTSTRQTFRPTIEPLQPVRIYMVHDNIDITEQPYASHYSNVNDSTMYNILLKPTEHAGYVQLQLLDDFATSKGSAKEDELDLSSIAEDDDELFSDGDSVYGPKPRSNLSTGSIISDRSRKQARSLPNLCDEETEVRDRRTLSRSNRNIVKAASDYDNYSSSEERGRTSKKVRSKGKTKREKQLLRSKNQGAASSNSSGYRSDNYSDYSYNTSEHSRFSENCSDADIDESWIMNGEFPNRCFKKVTYTSEGKIYNPKEDQMHLLNSKQRRIKLALRRHNYDLFYVSSTEFMKHFLNLFACRLADTLGFDEEAVNDAKREGCVLYCDKITVTSAFKHSRVEQYEIIPAVWLEWPIYAQEWLDRPRNTWPDCRDVEKIKDFGCYVVPEGFVPKRGTSNLAEDLEWQLTFPTAERYLETCMTQAQAQVYLIALMLHKTFMRPIFDTMFSLTASHIRHKLFWMIEENDRPSRWPDNAMGECLLKLLNSLYDNISQSEPALKDYFVKGRNLLQRVPSEHLMHTQKQLKRIVENPIMYVFHAMENIRYHDDFFPRLNFELLLRILTADALALINPTLARNVSRPISQAHEEYVAQYDKQSGQLATDKTLIRPRKATDSIIEIWTRCAELNGPRICALLDFFIRHFITMAERCNYYQAFPQKAIYLNHAERLSILLFEYPVFKEVARAYRDEIKVLRKKTAGSKSQDEPPETPRRNLETAIFVAPMNDRFSNNKQEQRTPNKVPSEPQTRSNKSIDRVQNVTKAIVHEQHYEQPDEQNSNAANSGKATSVLTTESETSESNADVNRPTVIFFGTEPVDDESTYI